MDVFFRVHEWLADRVSFVQYPNIRAVRRKPAKRPIEDRVLIGALSIGALAVGAGLIVAGLFVLYVVISSLF
ncbi:hypothetical protein [Ralstonia mannitolilytica]|uniref:hypothetical protein n=1 Tax=Ralstonia mannitolilytica TaxID=105219 RepID=UPI000C7D00CA|nr:hypothetical protein [Ralstonia mannitolilytica]PLT18743.1 hypothetical protein CXP34_01690 [Ralstonia mannitolilytica]